MNVKDDEDAYLFMYEFVASILYSLENAPVLSLQFYPMLGELGQLSDKLNNQKKWNPKLFGILREASRNMIQTMFDKSTMDGWYKEVKRAHDKKFGANVKLMTSEVYQVDPTVYGDKVLPWQKTISKTIPKQDLEVLAQASKLFDIQDDILAEIGDEEEVLDDEEESSTLTPVDDEPPSLTDVLEQSLQENIELREKTSTSSTNVYKSFKGRRQFQLGQNMIYAESKNFSFLLRLDADLCPYFDNDTNRFCTNKTNGSEAFCMRHQSFENTQTMRTLKNIGSLKSFDDNGYLIAKDVLRPVLVGDVLKRVLEYCPSVEGALPAWKDMVQNSVDWFTACHAVFKTGNTRCYESFQYET